MQDATSATSTVRPTVLYERPAEGVVRIVQNRPDARNAQNLQMTYDLVGAFDEAIRDDEVKVIILAGAGKHFSAGHDLSGDGGRTWRDFPSVSEWGDFDAAGAEGLYSREKEIYLGATERLYACSKPTIAEVQGWCIAGGLMLAWACDLIVAAEDARFMDAVIDLGICGVEFFAHPWELGVRKAKEHLFMAEPFDAAEAHRLGMVNRVVAAADLTATTLAMASKIASKPAFALKLTKEAVNAAHDASGRRLAMQQAFALHQLAHAHNRDQFDMIIDPRGLPEPVRSNVIERVRKRLPEAALKKLGLA